MRHSSQSDEAPATSCSEVFQGGACDLDTPAPSSLARSSSASDIMEPFIAERVKGEDPQRDPTLILNPPHQHSTTSLLATNSHAAQPLPHTLTSPFPTLFTFSNGVVSSTSEGQDDGSTYDQFWHHTGSQSQGSSSDWVSEWDSAFAFSSEKDIDEEDSEMGVGAEEDDLFSSIRDYLTQKGGERKEEAGEGDSRGYTLDSVTLPTPVETGVARTQVEHTGQLREAIQVIREDRQVSNSVRHSSVDSAEENEAEQRSIYECLELQCQWPSPSSRGSSSSERNMGEKKGEEALEGKCDMWREIGEKKQDEAAANERPFLIRQDPVEFSTEANQTPQTSDTTKAKASRSSTKRHHSGSVHVSFRPSTESVQFHNPLESKEAHWKARLRRLSHFHTHSHSAGERPGTGLGSGGKFGAGGAGKFGSVAGISHRAGAHEKLASGTFMDNSRAGGTAGIGGLENRSGSGVDNDKQYPGSCVGSSLGSELHSEVSSDSLCSSGVRGRLGRSALRSRASRSRSQEPGSTVSRHHQGALLGGVYKTVVHALSSKPRPRGQGSSQGSSPQRQGRAAMGDASLRDLYSHVLGYFGRKTSTPGEDCKERSAHKGHSRLWRPKYKTQTSTLFSFLAVFNWFVMMEWFFKSFFLADTHHLAAGLKFNSLLMCFLLNVAPPQACLLSRTHPPSSHTLPLVSLPEKPPSSFSCLLSSKGFGILTSSIAFPFLHLLPLLNVACGLLVPPSPPPMDSSLSSATQKETRKKELQVEMLKAQIKEIHLHVHNTREKAFLVFIAFCIFRSL